MADLLRGDDPPSPPWHARWKSDDTGHAPLTLMAVHAHPDDEASSGGILALYADQGVRVIVVTCTNGEFGDAPGRIKPGEEGHDPQAVAPVPVAEVRQAAQNPGGAGPGTPCHPQPGK